MLRTRTASLLAVLTCAGALAAAQPAIAQDAQFLDGCTQSCTTSSEVREALQANEIDGACNRYCKCNLTQLLTRMSRRDLSTLDMRSLTPAALNAINAARRQCMDEVLVPLVKPPAPPQTRSAL